jgi:acyl-CoA dehydrogenase
LIDLDTPGIEVKPIINMTGDHEFNQIFFTDVLVPKSRRLGEENKGWDVARHLLQFEHGAGLVRANAAMRGQLDWVREIAEQECDGYGGRVVNDPDFARRYAEAEIATSALNFAAQQALKGDDASVPPPAIAELLNIRNREVVQALTQLAVDAIGYYAIPFVPEARQVGSPSTAPGPSHTLMPTPVFLSHRASTIAGGTPEVHRNNMARNLLKI